MLELDARIQAALWLARCGYGKEAYETTRAALAVANRIGDNQAKRYLFAAMSHARRSPTVSVGA